MAVPDKRHWFNIGAIVPAICVLFSFLFCLFVGPVMTIEADGVWVAGIIVIAILVWFNAAKQDQKSEQRERDVIEKFNELKQLIEKPGTTFDEVREAASRLGVLSNSPLASSEAQANVHKLWNP
jgi:hypothetical protein